MPVQRIEGVHTGQTQGEAEEEARRGLMTTTLGKALAWARKNSMWPATFGLACCAIEMMATGAADYDLARWGMEIFRASPRQADLLIVAGRVTPKEGPVLGPDSAPMPRPNVVNA